MAITEVRLIAETVSEQHTTGYSITEVYQVIADAVLTATSARTATDGSTTIPAFRAACGSDSSALALRIGSRRKDEGSDLVWFVTVDYRTPTRYTLAEDPLDDDIQIDWSSWAWSEIVAKEQDGTVITNSANQPFATALMQDAHDMQVTIVRNESSYNPVLAFAYHNTVNSDSTTIAGLPVTARQAKLVEWGGRSAERSGTDYWVNTYRIMFKSATWDREVEDMSTVYLSGSAQLPIRMKHLPQTTSVDESFVSEPVHLNGSGAVATNAASQATLTFQTYTQKAFAPLGLNITE